MKRLSISMLFLLLIAVAHGQECPPVPPLSGTDINADTRASLSAIQRLLGSLSVSSEFNRSVRNVFIEHPEAIQWYVALVMYHDGCVVIRDDKKLSPNERLVLLESLRKATVPQFQLAPVASTSPLSPTKPRATPPTKPRANRSSLSPRIEGGAFSRTYSLIYIQETRVESLTWAQKYLRPVPILVTRGNQYWVNVDYANNREDGERKLSLLKRQYPTYDFALYRPFGRNDKWNIVMATWVSEQEAQSILDIARSINPTSFLWRACSAMNGDQCVLNRKLRLAIELAR